VDSFAHADSDDSLTCVGLGRDLAELVGQGSFVGSSVFALVVSACVDCHVSAFLWCLGQASGPDLAGAVPGFGVLDCASDQGLCDFLGNVVFGRCVTTTLVVRWGTWKHQRPGPLTVKWS
jgi:hypothetical protein